MPDVFVAPTPQPKKEKVTSGKPVESVSSERESPTEVISKPQEGKPVFQSKFSSPLASMMVNPTHLSFEAQEEGEEVILLLRRHWVTNLPWIFVGGFLFLIPPFVSIFVSLLNFSLQLPFGTVFVAQAFWYLISFGYLFVNFLIWYFNAYLVTNQRIVDIDFNNLTYKEISSTELEKVQDITFRVGGVIRHIFDYGDVIIQTAGTAPNFDFLAVPKPAFVADKIGDLAREKGGGENEP
ncbi:MAG: PH domain-containing protein [bacterium]|nr:PH domain-containing protein [bacterium]